MLSFVLKTNKELTLILIHFYLVAQMLEVFGLVAVWTTCDDFEVQVTATSAVEFDRIVTRGWTLS